jgi:RNA polymerase sigma-70 factor (ECF subfamily)
VIDATRAESVSSTRAEDALGDRALVTRVIEGRDEWAFRALYARHTTALYAMAMRLTAEPADAEDAVHDAWVRAIEALPRFEWRSSLRTWLTSILLNRLREVDRQERHTVPIDDDLAAGEPLVELPRAVDPLDLEAAIRALPAGYRRVLVLHDIEGFTHEDIAALLGVTAGTSKSQLAHARRHVRRTLSPDSEGIS